MRPEDCLATSISLISYKDALQRVPTVRSDENRRIMRTRPYGDIR